MLGDSNNVRAMNLFQKEYLFFWQIQLAREEFPFDALSCQGRVLDSMAAGVGSQVSVLRVFRLLRVVKMFKALAREFINGILQCMDKILQRFTN